MKTFSFATALATMMLGALAASASAAIVTVGSPLTGSFLPTSFNEIATAANVTLPEPGAQLVSPISGTVIRWRLTAAAGGPFRLRVLRPGGAGAYAGAGTSGPAVPTALTTQTFSAKLPIQVGDLIGLDNTSVTDMLGTIPSLSGAEFIYWTPQLAEGETRSTNEKGEKIEVGFNADVQPLPALASVAPRAGPFKGGTKVTIIGSDFTGATSVTFGAKPATIFTVDSEGQITAIAPPGTPGSTDITVTTLAGTNSISAADQFKYTACVVPKLNARKLKAAKKKLKNAGCKVGKVVKEDGVSAKTGKVVGQNPKPGKILAAGTKVKVILG